MRLTRRVTDALFAHRRVALAILLATLLFVGAGTAQLQDEQTLERIELGTTEEAKLDYVESNFSADQANETYAQVVVRGDDVLEKETLIQTLALQQELRRNDTVAPTLVDDRPTAGVANVVATAAIRAETNVTDPTLAQQKAALQRMDQRQIDAVTRRVLAENGSTEALAFMPSDYEPGTTNASATMIVVAQSAEEPVSSGNAPDDIVDAQTAIEDIAAGEVTDRETLVVGDGLLTHETAQSRQDTFQLAGPLALLFVLVTLAAVYRDLFDILLSVLGIALVQVWTFGALGWLGIAFNPILIAIPVLLIGLSIDYGIHVFMRYRERRATKAAHGPVDAGTAMRGALAGVGAALVWVTVTTVVGFLSNLASPLGAIQEIGIMSATGIVGALVVFGGVVPLLKVEADSLAVRLGFDRDQRPVGAGGGYAARLLSVGSTAARRAPVAVLVFAVLLTAVATVGAVNVSTSFGPEDYVAEDPAEWTEQLPEPFAPGEYSAKENRQYVADHFVQHDAQAEILVEGNVTDPATLERVDRAEEVAAEKNTAVTLADGSARTQSPLATMDRVAAQNDTFAATLSAADTDGDGVPDRNVTAVYDALYETAPQEATRVLHRDDGQYRALRVAVSVESGADGHETTDEMNAVAGVLDGDGRTATATGEPIVRQLVQDHLLRTVLVSLAITLLAVLAVLAVAYRVVHGSATLGVVTLVPVTFAVAWIIGTMYVVGYPLSVVTSVVASITVGIGIDYSIHVSERFSHELDRHDSVAAAIETTTRGTGAALLGSAVTTAAGFGVLSVAFLPSLQQFGVITALMIVYAFLGSVLVLPSLLVLWARYVGHEIVSQTPVDPNRPSVEVTED